MKDTVRDLSSPQTNKDIDACTLETLEHFRNAAPGEIQERLEELEKQWDLECYVELVGGALTIAGGGLAASSPKKLWWAPLIGGALVLWHSLPVPDPLTPILRLFGIWSRQEIERERFALKILRGDFERFSRDRSNKSALAVAQGNVGLKTGGGMRGEKRSGVRRRELGEKQKPPAKEASTEPPLGEDLRPDGDPDRIH